MRSRRAVAIVESTDAAANPGDARQRLIAAGLRLFGAHGFDGTSSRTLAEAARVNLAAIPYYFGGKEGLYRAAAQYVVEFNLKKLSPVLSEIDRAITPGANSRRVARQLLHSLLDRFSEVVIGPGLPDEAASFVMREQLHPGAAFEILYEGMMRGILSATARLLAILLKRSSDDPRLLIKAHAILGEVLIFRCGREASLRMLGWKGFSEDRLRLIQSLIREDVDLITRHS